MWNCRVPVLLRYLQRDLYGENGSEEVVEVVEHLKM